VIRIFGWLFVVVVPVDCDVIDIIVDLLTIHWALVIY